jgi:uncharacterized membrane protein YeiB
MKRYVTLDFLRGVAIFGMIFVHILDDIYNLSWTENDATLQAAPLAAVVLLLMGIYFGSWAGLFLMVSATGNMVSMYNGLEKGKSIKSVILKQVVGGLILLFFGFLAEGTLQYYAVFQTIRMGNLDLTRIIWKGYTMETIHAIAWCMILNGIVQGLLSFNEGHRKIKRNIWIYVILAIIVVALTQPVWDGIKALIPGYPFDPLNTGRDLQYPSVNASFGEYILKFFILPLAGQPEPVFPFLAVSFIGSILGLKLCETPVTRTWPKRGIIIGVMIMIFGALFGVIMDLPFDSFFPINDFSTFTRIGHGLNWRWLTWICFITGGQLILVSFMFRLVEFRGESALFAQKTAAIRRFGMVAFTLYTFHRIIAMVPLLILSAIFQTDMTIDVHNLNGYVSLGAIGFCLLFIYLLLLLWEKIDYIGSLEWMIGTIAAYILGIPKKSTQKEKWYRWGAKDQKELFYNAEWINVFEATDNGGVKARNSKLMLKISIGALFAFPLTIINWLMWRPIVKLEGKNSYNQKGFIILVIATVLDITAVVVLYFLNLGILGISL